MGNGGGIHVQEINSDYRQFKNMSRVRSNYKELYHKFPLPRRNCSILEWFLSPVPLHFTSQRLSPPKTRIFQTVSCRWAKEIQLPVDGILKENAAREGDLGCMDGGRVRMMDTPGWHRKRPGRIHVCLANFFFAFYLKSKEKEDAIAEKVDV